LSAKAVKFLSFGIVAFGGFLVVFFVILSMKAVYAGIAGSDHDVSVSVATREILKEDHSQMPKEEKKSPIKKPPDPPKRESEKKVQEKPKVEEKKVKNYQDSSRSRELPNSTGGIRQVEKGHLSEISDKIYQLESSGGRNDGCRRIGLYNGYGFRQNKKEWKCFKSHGVARELVIDWLNYHLNKEHLTISQALCHYNQGSVTNDCGYHRKYLRL
jgi:hypothetical protein